MFRFKRLGLLTINVFISSVHVEKDASGTD